MKPVNHLPQLTSKRKKSSIIEKKNDFSFLVRKKSSTLFVGNIEEREKEKHDKFATKFSFSGFTSFVTKSEYWN